MTIKELANMEYPLGMPTAWIFTPDGEYLKDDLGRPVSRYLTEFEYVYDEESDDRCNLTFQFPDVSYFDLPYFTNDVILVVQWGFILPNGETIKSPKRKIAVRDKKTSYTTNGYELSLECSDLVAYLKGYNTQTITKYGGAGAALAIGLTAKANENFLDFIKEIKTDQFVATVVTDVKAIKFSKQGMISVADYNPVTNEYTNKARINDIDKDLYEDFTVKQIQKGKSKAITATIKEYMRYLDATSNGDGTYIMDTTGDEITIKKRNFDQKPFKTFIFNGEPRDLIDFDTSTDTRRIEEDLVSSSGVDPYTKETNTTEVGIADTSKEGNDEQWWVNKRTATVDGQEVWYPGDDLHLYKESVIVKTDDGEVSVPKGSPQHSMAMVSEWIEKYTDPGKPRPNTTDFRIPTAEELGSGLDSINNSRPRWRRGMPGLNHTNVSDEVKDKFAADLYTAFIRGIKFPDESNDIPDFSYAKAITDEQRKMMPKGFYRGIEKMTLPAKTVINWPGMMDRFRDQAEGVLKETIKEKMIQGHAIEKIQRKFEGGATMLGDPSLIKGRTYNFFGLSKEDSGKWYATKVSHKMSISRGYICTMDILRKPKPVFMATIDYRGKRQLLDDEEKMSLDAYVSKRGNVLFPELEKEAIQELQQEQNEVGEMQYRIDTLEAEEDFKGE